MDESQPYTTDPFFDGRIVVKQSRSGYRFSIDAILLAASITLRPGDRVVDLGTGCGIIPLILNCRFPDTKIYGIEVQKDLAALAGENVFANSRTGRIEIWPMDMKALAIGMFPGTVNLVVSNPPYRKVLSGRVNPNRERARARHEITITLWDLVDTAKRVLSKSGRFIMIYPSQRLADAITTLRASDLEPKHVRPIHSHADSEAKLVIIESMKGGRSGLTVAPPLTLYQPDGTYTKEVQSMFRLP